MLSNFKTIDAGTSHVLVTEKIVIESSTAADMKMDASNIRTFKKTTME